MQIQRLNSSPSRLCFIPSGQVESRSMVLCAVAEVAFAFILEGLHPRSMALTTTAVAVAECRNRQPAATNWSEAGKFFMRRP